MKKLILSGTILIIQFLPLLAQLDFGIKAGLNISNFKSEEVSNSDYLINPSASGNLGYHAGGFMRASLFGLFIQPELVFTSMTTEFTVTDIHAGSDNLAKQKMGRLDIPVLIGVKLGSLRLGLGPVASIILSSDSEIGDYVSDYKAQLKSATFGFQTGIGLGIWKLDFDARYEGSLSKYAEQVSIGGADYNLDGRTRQFIFSLGYAF